ncbi:MAG TPA: DegT/DnrJ/EryC1/StrS aminotransferase family protein [Syntrophales bacterium]|jgi:dTDP-4-amino-4,6-dideoxygalactose transaminase|nr:DegT/DnrJ/EryC1/StrS aminotransferase family protein [Syntrophales bacterium]
MITHSRPTLDESDRKAVLNVLVSGHLVQGKQVARFEGDLASFVGVKHGVAVSSGTAALHLSLLALDVGPGDEAILPTFVCDALLQAVSYTGATPVLADIDPRTFNIAPSDLEKRITKKTKAVIVPHMFGLPADMAEILSLGIPVIEDCAQAVGAKYNGVRVGSLGKMSIFSFYATKMLATGEGGMILSGDENLLEKIRDLRDYDEREDHRLRYNYKMTDMQAALGVSQLKKLPLFIWRRREIAEHFNGCLNDGNAMVPFEPSGREHVYYRYVVLLEGDALPFIDDMRKRGVDCRRPVFKPLHRYLGLSGYPVAEDVWKRSVSIPLYPSMMNGERRQIAEHLQSLLAR